MAVIRWASILIFLICMGVFSTGVRDWLVLVLAVVAFLTCCWTFRDRSRKSRWIYDADENSPEPFQFDELERAHRSPRP